LKPQPPPHVEGKTEYERFDNAMRKVLSVRKSETVKHEKKAPQPQKKAK
jgi:hypothetical protein